MTKPTLYLPRWVTRKGWHPSHTDFLEHIKTLDQMAAAPAVRENGEHGQGQSVRHRCIWLHCLLACQAASRVWVPCSGNSQRPRFASSCSDDLSEYRINHWYYFTPFHITSCHMNHYWKCSHFFDDLIGNQKKVGHLWDLEGAKERLELVRADLLEEGSFDDAVMACEGVFHTASPIITKSDSKVC